MIDFTNFKLNDKTFLTALGITFAAAIGLGFRGLVDVLLWVGLGVGIITIAYSAYNQIWKQ